MMMFGAYNTNGQIKFKATIVMSSLCDFSNVYILVKETIAVVGVAGRSDKQSILKNCAPFIDSIREINNAHIGNAKDLDVVMPIYNLIEYSDNIEKLRFIKE